MTPLVLIAYHQFPDIQVERGVLEAIGAEVRHVRDLSDSANADALRQAAAVMVTIEAVPADLLERMEHCRIISRVGTGLDAIDVNAATNRGIWVTYVPDYCVDEVAMHTLGLLLTLARRIPALISATREGTWNYEEVRPFSRLNGQVLGLLGFGHIGREVAAKSRGLGLEVFVHDPFVDPSIIESAGARPVDWETLLREADFLSLHAPLTDSTRAIINAEALTAMKPTAFLINTARGGLIDEEALLKAVEDRQIAGAALDVLTQEPPSPDNPLLRHERVIVTPHIGWYSEDSSHEVRLWGAEEVVRVLNGERPRSPVNELDHSDLGGGSHIES